MKRRNPRQVRFAKELKRLLRRGVPAAQAMKKAWKRVPKNPRKHRVRGRRPRGRNPKKLTRKKARAILHHGHAGGLPLTPEQRGLFGAIASGYRLREYNAPPAIKLYGNGRLLGVIGFRPTRGRRVGRNPRIDIRV